MQDNASGNGGRSATGEISTTGEIGTTGEISTEEIGPEVIGPSGAATSGADRRDATQSSAARPKTGPGRPKNGPGSAKRRGRGRRSALVYLAGGALGIGIGVGVGGLVKIVDSSPASAYSVIPSPPAANAKFVEDDNGTDQDNQDNILQSTAPGLVHIVSPGRVSAGLGLILTPSGKVLTSDQAIQGGRRVAVRVVLSGRTFAARVIGSDAAADLALLQVEGGSGFTPAAIGTSRDLAVGDAVTSVGSAGVTRTFTLYLGNVTSLKATATVGGRRLAGLLQTTSQVTGSPEVGGPLVNLSGQVVGIDVAGAGSSLHSTGFAISINTALAVAKQIDARHS